MLSSVTYASLLLLAAVPTLGVNIQLYEQVVGMTPCTSEVLLYCTDINLGDCCYIPNEVVGQVLFSRLPTDGIPGYGITYNNQQDFGCTGDSSQADFGNNVCISGGVFTGAEWLRPQNKRQEPKQNCNTTALTHLAVGDRRFNIFGDVPEDVSTGMIAYFKNESNHAEGVEKIVPDLFLPFEDLAFNNSEA